LELERQPDCLCGFAAFLQCRSCCIRQGVNVLSFG
jgi:hypothetical protein